MSQLTTGVNYPDELWQSRPELEHIRQAAFARMIPPDAALGCVLARVVALTHHALRIPAIVGRVGSLNLFVAIVTASGVGKGSSADIAADLITAPGLLGGPTLAGDFIERPVGSGEGMVRAFFRKVKIPDTNLYHLEQKTWNALFRIDEGELLARLGQRRDQTTMTVLRQLWSGELVGNSYADDEKNLRIPAHGARVCLILGVQPELGRFLLGDTAAGTPQRFTYVSGKHTGIPTPDTIPEWPGLLNWRVRRPSDGFVDVDPAVCAELRTAHWHRVTGDGNDTHGAHAGLRQLKVAIALAVLNGRHNVTPDDWQLATTIENTSTIVRASMAQAVATEDSTRYHLADKVAVKRQLAVADALEDREAATVERVARVIVRRVHKLGGSATRRVLHRSIAGRDRAQLDPAIEHAMAAEWLPTNQ